MIVASHELTRFRGSVTLVDGVFDPLHEGHIEYFRAARELGLPLLCNVAGDAYTRRKHAPLLTEEQRAHVLDAIRWIDYVHINRSSTADVIAELRPRFYAKGSDWRGRLPAAETDACRRVGADIVFLETVQNSSTRLLEAYRRRTEASP